MGVSGTRVRGVTWVWNLTQVVSRASAHGGRQMKTWKLYVQALSMSFIASSCCLLQLIVSLFGASCLGVVKTLQPFQAPLTAAVCVWWVHRARTCCSEERRLLLVPFFLSVGLLFSPLLIDLNVRARVSTDDLNTIHVSTQDVGCNACALAAKLSLEE